MKSGLFYIRDSAFFLENEWWVNRKRSSNRRTLKTKDHDKHVISLSEIFSNTNPESPGIVASVYSYRRSVERKYLIRFSERKCLFQNSPLSVDGTSVSCSAGPVCCHQNEKLLMGNFKDLMLF